MATCPNCNKETDGTAKFCNHCGAALPEMVFCPNCGSQTSADAAICQACGASLSQEPAPAQDPVAETPAAGGAKKWITMGVAAVAVIAVVAIVITLFGSLFGSKANYALYIKDKEMMMTGISKIKPWQVTEDLIDGDASNLAAAGMASELSGSVELSKDGKTIFYMDKLSDGGSLYFRTVGKPKKDATKIDSDVSIYSVSESGKCVTYLKDGTLYQHDLKEKEKIASEVSSYRVSNDGKMIAYITDEGEAYFKRAGKDKEKIDSDIEYFELCSKDRTTVYYVKEDSFYMKKVGKDKEKLASDVSSVLKVYESGEAYYLKTDDDDVRTLYYYNGKDEKEILENVVGWNDYALKAPVVIVSVSEDEDGEEVETKVVIEDAVSDLDQSDIRNVSIDDEGKVMYFLADVSEKTGAGDLYKAEISGKKVKKAEKYDSDVCYGFFLDEDLFVYCKDEKDDKVDLYMNKKSIDTDVYLDSLEYHKESGAFAYYTDWNDEKGYGTLKVCPKGKALKVEDDVHSFAFTPEGEILYLYDYSTEHYKGDLFLYKNKKSKKIDEDVAGIVRIQTWEALYGDK